MGNEGILPGGCSKRINLLSWRQLSNSFYLLGLSLLAGCSRADRIKDFTSDGCSLFPDKSLISEEEWCDCCFEHDIAYWQGGTKEERLNADIALRACILDKTGKKELAETMYAGVRFGGSPYFYNWYRWGYGWNYERKYRALTEEEEQEVARKLQEYYESRSQHPCKK